MSSALTRFGGQDWVQQFPVSQLSPSLGTGEGVGASQWGSAHCQCSDVGMDLAWHTLCCPVGSFLPGWFLSASMCTSSSCSNSLPVPPLIMWMDVEGKPSFGYGTILGYS